jgi:extracellular elastinolytic metalloproteinase
VVAALALVSTSAGAPGERGRKLERGAEQARGSVDVSAQAAAAPARANAAQAALARSLGIQGVVEVDALTDTPRVVARLDGFLTSPSGRDAKTIALDYVRAHPGVFKLDEDDLARLHLVRDYTDIGGTHHLVWAQTSRGIDALDSALRANLTRDGRLINVLGSPVPDLVAPALSPRVGAVGAVSETLRSVGRTGRTLRRLSVARSAERTTRFAGRHRASLSLLYDGTAARLAWNVTAHADDDEVYAAVVDAASGAILRRVNKVKFADALVFDNYPGALIGGTQRSQDITGWLNLGATTLIGPNAHIFSDLNDVPVNSANVDPGEEVGPSDGTNWNYAFTEFNQLNSFCAGAGEGASMCSWNSWLDGSWSTNQMQDATQVFYFVNNFHDHLAAPPIGFNTLAGAFDAGDDILLAQNNDGADVGSPLGPNMPDLNHLSNANMWTPPDGFSPEMQMYLFTSFTGPTPPGQPFDPTPDVNGGDDASIVYHEYGHGLSNRLVTHPNGVGALDRFQPGAMGEAWSDWYAMDYLVAEGFEPDDPAVQGEVEIAVYADGGNRLLRSEGLDCLRSPVVAECPGSQTAGPGGYTFGDLGKVVPGGPEVHGDGEIWGQTLWQLRRAVGVMETRTLVTRAMELSPPEPTFLQMRNAILQADQANFGGAHKAKIWSVFANRGMGFLAWTAHSNSVSTVQDFSLPRSFLCLSRRATRIGTNGPDVIYGTGGADVIVANGGHDRIYGRGGRDVICGGAGNDTIVAGLGRDRVDAGSGNDRVNTKDRVRERTIRGGPGIDRLRKDRRDRATGFERRF